MELYPSDVKKQMALLLGNGGSGITCLRRSNCPENLECEAGADKIFIDDCPSFKEGGLE